MNLSPLKRSLENWNGLANPLFITLKPVEAEVDFGEVGIGHCRIVIAEDGFKASKRRRNLLVVTGVEEFDKCLCRCLFVSRNLYSRYGISNQRRRFFGQRNGPFQATVSQ